MALSDLHKKFLDDLKVNAASQKTIEEYRRDFKLLEDFLGSNDIRLLTPERMRDYPRWLGERRLRVGRQGYSPRSVARQMASTSSFCKWLVARGDLKRNPFDGLKRPKRPKQLPRAIPIPWLDAIFHLPDLTPPERAFMAIIRFCGVRVSEVLNLTVNDVDLEEGVLVIRHGKGNKDRAIPLDAEAVVALAPYVLARKATPDAFLFQSPNGGVMTRGIVGRMLDNLARRAGVPRFTVHQVRHTFGTEAAKSGMPLPVLQAVMGHESPTTTALYIEVAAQDLRDGMAALAAWRRGRQPAQEGRG